MNVSDINNEKSKVAPLLVQLYDSHRIYDVNKDQDSGARMDLANAVGELLESDISPSESEIIADIMISMIEKAEQDLKIAIADKIADLDNTPLRLLIHMTNDDIAVAGKILENSPVLCDMDLMYVIQSRNAEYCDFIAKRKTLGGAVMTALAETKYPSTVKALLENSDILLNESVITTATDMVGSHEDLAKPLLARKEITETIVKKVYEVVSDELKAYVLENFEDELKGRKAEIDLVFTEAKEELTEQSEAQDDAPAMSIVRSAELMKKNRLISTELLITMLKKSEVQTFVAYFSAFCDLPHETSLAILKQKNGKGLAICCKANDVLKTDFVTLYLLTQKIRGEGKIVDQTYMTKAMDYFDQIDVKKAKQILQASQIPKDSFVVDL